MTEHAIFYYQTLLLGRLTIVIVCKFPSSKSKKMSYNYQKFLFEESDFPHVAFLKSDLALLVIHFFAIAF